MEEWFGELLHFPANVGPVDLAPCPSRAKPLARKN